MVFMIQGLIIGAGRHAGRRAGGTRRVVRARPLQAHPGADGRLSGVAYVPLKVLRLRLSCVVVSAVVIRFLATIYPSRQASRLDPAAALRVRMTWPFPEVHGDRQELSGRQRLLTVLRGISTSRSRRARWWRSSARQGSARARCCTCWADSTARRRERARSARTVCTTLADAERRRVSATATSASCSSSTTCCPSSARSRTSRCRCASRACRSRRRARAPRSCSSASGSATGSRTARARSRAASSSGWRSRARSSCARAGAGRRADGRSGRAHRGRPRTRLLREMHRSHQLTSVIATHNTRLAAGCDRSSASRTARLALA